MFEKKCIYKKYCQKRTYLTEKEKPKTKIILEAKANENNEMNHLQNLLIYVTECPLQHENYFETNKGKRVFLNNHSESIPRKRKKNHSDNKNKTTCKKDETETLINKELDLWVQHDLKILNQQIKKLEEKNKSVYSGPYYCISLYELKPQSKNDDNEKSSVSVIISICKNSESPLRVINRFVLFEDDNRNKDTELPSREENHFESKEFVRKQIEKSEREEKDYLCKQNNSQDPRYNCHASLGVFKLALTVSAACRSAQDQLIT